MKNKTRVSLVMLLSLCAVFTARAQDGGSGYGGFRPYPVQVKTNLLYDATGTINLGVEFRTGKRTSFDLPFNYNGWDMKDNRKWKHFLVQPEWRWWTGDVFDRHFFGVHAHYAYYNIGNLPDPFTDYMKAYRFEGWLAGAGASYGYRWNFNREDPRWALEATIGVGYAYKDYDRFLCVKCGEKIDSDTKHYFGPTKVGLSLVMGIGRRAAAPEMPIMIPTVIYMPNFLASYVVPEVEDVKRRSESGSAYLDFVVNRSEILHDFRNNAAELKKIYTTIEQVQGNPDATITGITITGWASPEGSAESNQSLSDRRAESLRNHIGSKYMLPNNLLAAYGKGEDWGKLEKLVASSTLPQKGELTGIIRSGGDADAREGRLKAVAGGAPYRHMLADLYPQLRRSDYTISYTVVPFTVAKGKEVMRTRPNTLSLNEMFLIANTYQPGSESFNEVFETAVQVFPESDVANINAAANALGRKDAVSAARYLGRVKSQTPAYWNNLGILQWMQGDKAAAADSFEKAGRIGTKNADELRQHLQAAK